MGSKLKQIENTADFQKEPVDGTLQVLGLLEGKERRKFRNENKRWRRQRRGK